MFSLDKKIAVVTGAASGIGASIALRLGAAGAFVWALDINFAGATSIAEQVADLGGMSQALRCDVSDEVSCKKALDDVTADGKPHCDILVNNAGVGHVGTTLTTTPDDLERLWAVNVKGILNMTRQFLPPMLDAGRGAVINLASIGGIIGIKDRLAYCTTKFAVVGMTKCMALDHAPSKVRFNCVCPGRVETPFMRARVQEYPDPETAYRQMCDSQALKRMGEPEEIAAAVHYLASDEAQFVTGSSLIIDGGWSAGKCD